jgi:tRNA(Ile2) C34 agmatinyltransferase TiaS
MNDEYNVSQCPVCDGDGASLGILGHFEWYRCRDCGIEFKKDTRTFTTEGWVDANDI